MMWEPAACSAQTLRLYRDVGDNSCPACGDINKIYRFIDSFLMRVQVQMDFNVVSRIFFLCKNHVRHKLLK